MPADETYFLDMLNAALMIKEFTQGMAREDFNMSSLHQNAVTRLIQVIGEAARLVSEEAKAAHPEIAWRKIAAMRNIIVHRYFNIDLDVVWEVISVDADQLIGQLRPLIPPESH